LDVCSIQYFDGKIPFHRILIRRDGSSQFGSDNKWGNSHHFGLGWVLSKILLAKAETIFLKITWWLGKVGNQMFLCNKLF
jgi:hypothetical protein